MRQNSKSFGANPATGEQLINFAPVKISNTPTQTDDSLVTSQESSRIGAGVAGGMVVEDVKMDEPNVIARDMTLLADMVSRRRAAGRGDDLDTRDWQGSFAIDSNDPKDPEFPPVRIVLHGEDEVHVVDSIERAIDCLTTLWPVHNGEAYEKALQTCIDGIKGRASPMQVRSAFVDAADMAGILLHP